MPPLPWLTLVSDIDPPMASTAQSSPSTTALARLAGRGALRLAWDRGRTGSALRPWQRGLLTVLQLPEASYPSAPLSVLGYTGNHQAAGWMHAEPVHFVAGLDRLSFLSLQHQARVTPAERKALFTTLLPHFSSGDFTLHALGGDWFLRTSGPLQVQTSPPDAAAANDLRTAMPVGADAAVLHRVMTELQMVLHEHPVNEVRARLGLPAINAVWLWGGGSGGISPAAGLPLAFGDDAFLRGLYQLSGLTARTLPYGASALLPDTAAAKRAVVVAMTDDMDALESQWIAPLTQALAAGGLGRLDLVLGEWHVDVQRSGLRRFWRRPRPASQWERPA